MATWEQKQRKWMTGLETGETGEADGQGGWMKNCCHECICNDESWDPEWEGRGGLPEESGGTREQSRADQAWVSMRWDSKFIRSKGLRKGKESEVVVRERTQCSNFLAVAFIIINNTFTKWAHGPAFLGQRFYSYSSFSWRKTEVVPMIWVRKQNSLLNKG